MTNNRTKISEFSAVSLKNPVAKKFRKFSKKIAATHSETINVMIDFFERNSISPHDDMGENMVRLEKNLQKRINAVIAIIRDIEKNQTKPSTAILQALLEQPEKEKKPLMLEKKRLNPDPSNRNRNLREF